MGGAAKPQRIKTAAVDVKQLKTPFAVFRRTLGDE
jgi:hypothetical protein